MTIDEYSSINLILKDYKSLLRDIRELQTKAVKSVQKYQDSPAEILFINLINS